MRFNEINDTRTDEALGNVIRGGVVAGKKAIQSVGSKLAPMAQKAGTAIKNTATKMGTAAQQRMSQMGTTPASGSREVGPGNVQQGAPTGSQQAGGPGMPDPNDTSPEAMKVKQQQKKQLQAQLKKITTDYKTQSAQLKGQIASIK